MSAFRKTINLIIAVVGFALIISIPVYAEEADYDDCAIDESNVCVEENTKLFEGAFCEENDVKISKDSGDLNEDMLSSSSFELNLDINNAVLDDVYIKNDKINNNIVDENNSKADGLYYIPNAYLIDNQTVVLLTVSTNDSDSIGGVTFTVWTGDGSDMREYNSYLQPQPDGRWMAFVPVSDFGQAGTYKAFATVKFKDGHCQNVGDVFFDVSSIGVGSVDIGNINNRAGTFDVSVSNVYSPSGLKGIDLIALTRDDFSDVYVYQVSWDGHNYFSNINVGYHKYHYGLYKVCVVLYSWNGVKVEKWCEVNIEKPQTRLNTYTADNKNYFLIAENTPYDSICSSMNYYVWNEGLTDLRLYSGFRDYDRWLAILPITDYKKSGKYYFQVKGQMLFGPEIVLGMGTFDVESNSVKSVGANNINSSLGCFDIVIEEPQGLGGIADIRTLVFTNWDWSDAAWYTYMSFGNNTYGFRGEVSNHGFKYGTYMAAVLVKNSVGVEDWVSVISFNIEHPNTQSWGVPINDQADVVLASWDLPYVNHIMGIQYYVWNSGNDMRCYTTVSRRNNNSYDYTFSMNDFGKAGTFYVLPRIVRDNWSTEDLPLISFYITDINGNYGIMGSSGTNIDQMIRYFNKYGNYPEYYQWGYGGVPSVYDFCRIFYEECAAEGVRAEVAFCQAMKETGYLRFGGAVDVRAFNFAGIGAVDSSPGSYNWFPDIRTGIRAQVQHLKAYASTDPLNNACVDPRFNLITRGVAPCVEDLGGKWASGVNYGYSIRNDYMSKLFAS